MELNSFRELLLKKASDNPTLQTIISVMKDDIIAERIIEYLEKMARPHARMGAKANAGVTAFASQLKNKDVEMLRDALGHHISHYKAALKNGNREVADEHLKKIIPMIHLTAMSSPHSNGMLSADYINPQPWEANITTQARNKATNRREEETEGWGRRAKPNTSRVYTPKNYRYFEMPPHPDHEHIKNNEHEHRGGYPFEELQVGNPGKIDSKEAYLHIPDVQDTSKYVGHPFDNHPIHAVQDLSQSDFNDVAEDFVNKMNNWHDSQHVKDWSQKIKDEHAADPESFKLRGKSKPGSHFEGIKVNTMPHHEYEIPDDFYISLKENKKKHEDVMPEHYQHYPKRGVKVPSEEKPVAAPAPQIKVQKAPQSKGAELTPQQISALPPHLRAKHGGGK